MERDLNPHRLSVLTGISSASMHNYVYGAVPGTIAVGLMAAALEVPVEDLFTPFDMDAIDTALD